MGDLTVACGPSKGFSAGPRFVLEILDEIEEKLDMGSSAGLNMLRGLFVLLMAAVGWAFIVAEPGTLGELEESRWLAMSISLVLGVAMVIVDIVAGRRKLAIFSGVAFGVLIGLTIAYALSFGVQLIVDNLLQPQGVGTDTNRALTSFINLLIGTAAVFFSVSFILQTKDDFRFIIPYVEFRRETKGTKPIILDTSSLIDGRIRDVAAAGFLDAQYIVPQYVIHELQDVADSSERLKRARGRRGLDVLAELKGDRLLDVRIYDNAATDARDTPVDQRLINLAQELDGRVLTTDFNLNKVAQLSGVPVLNLNDLAAALKPEVLPGEITRVKIVKPGSGENQGIGYLDDGTMVVVEHGRDRLHEEIDLIVTNTTQSSAGRMIFGKAADCIDAHGDEAHGDSRDNHGPRRGRPRTHRLPETDSAHA
jgi:uncharacterized protein YacL